MSPIASRVLLRLALIFGAVILGGVLLWGVAGVGPQSLAPERGAALVAPEAVRQSLQERGLEVLSLERHGGLYTARVRDAEGERSLQIDGTSGAVIAMPEVSGPAVQPESLRRKLQAEGYTEIARIGWARGAYRTEATAPDGRRVALRLDTYSGEILASEPAE